MFLRSPDRGLAACRLTRTKLLVQKLVRACIGEHCRPRPMPHFASMPSLNFSRYCRGFLAARMPPTCNAATRYLSLPSTSAFPPILHFHYLNSLALEFNKCLRKNESWCLKPLLYEIGQHDRAVVLRVLRRVHEGDVLRLHHRDEFGDLRCLPPAPPRTSS